jgi:hypothetical protein
MDHEEQLSPSEPSDSKPKSKAKAKKPAWKDVSPAEMATHLLATPTLADRTWTDEQRLKGEKRDAFIRRILLGETGETSGTVDTDETVGTDETAAQAGIPAAPAPGGGGVVEQLEALGVRGILWQLARDGQITDVRCEMPQCYCFRGRRYFEPISPGADWMPTADHYPRLKMHGGRLTPDNVRLGHRLCNQRDYIWRVRINAMLGKRMSLEEIAEELNVKKVPTIHGTNRWTAASVRKAFVS